MMRHRRTAVLCSRLGVLCSLLALLVYSRSGGGSTAPVDHRQQPMERRSLAQEGGADATSAAASSRRAAAAAADPLVLEVTLAKAHLPKYTLPEELRAEAIMNGSMQHGAVTKVGMLPAWFWNKDKLAWRTQEFMKMVRTDMAMPRQNEYWEADASGQLALKPLPLPFPFCHAYVNHKYKMIFIIHPKSASTATKHYISLCRFNQTESCLEPLEGVAQLAPMDVKWQEYFVFTFVRNPWARAYSSWKFLREGYMLAAGQPRDKPSLTPCLPAGWADFCRDPLLLGRVCMALQHCCPGTTGPGFMFYHITDQATCMLTEGGGLAVDFIGRVEHVDEDMREAVGIINSRLPPGVTPLQLPQEVAPINVGPKHRGSKAPANSRYLPAYRGPNAACFSLISRFYEKDVRVMFPALYEREVQVVMAGGAVSLA